MMYNTICMIIGENYMFKDKLKELREKEGLSQEQLASIIYVSRSAIAKWESGSGLPSDVNLKAICDYFKVEEDYLLQKEDLKEAITDLDNKQTSLKIIFFSSVIFIMLFCLIVGGDYILHRIAMVLTLIFFIFKCFIKNNKIDKIICIIISILIFIISLVNWLIMSIGEPSSFFRILNPFDHIQSINRPVLNMCLSQLSSILNIAMLLTYFILFLIIGKSTKKH